MNEIIELLALIQKYVSECIEKTGWSMYHDKYMVGFTNAKKLVCYLGAHAIIEFSDSIRDLKNEHRCYSILN